MSASDWRLLVLALAVLLLPWPASLLMPLVGLLLVAQIGLLVMAVLTEPPGESEVATVALASDAVLLMALAVARVTWQEGNPFSGVGGWGLILGVPLNGLYLKWMLHHALAHQKMRQTYADEMPQRLATVQVDLEVGILDQDSAHQKRERLALDQLRLDSICALGQQAGGMALLQLVCLAVAATSDGSGGLWLGWALCVSLPGLINSKAQDVLLYSYVPRESRLC